MLTFKKVEAALNTHILPDHKFVMIKLFAHFVMRPFQIVVQAGYTALLVQVNSSYTRYLIEHELNSGSELRYWEGELVSLFSNL